ncbi:MAG: diguanylate cyclase [Gemmatimonadales bacterium]
MHTRVLLIGDPNSRPDGLERSLIRAGFTLGEATSLPASPGDAGSPDLTILTVGSSDAELDEALTPITDGGWRHVPTIVLLPEGGTEAVGRALSLGALDVMVAPVHLPELTARVVARLRGVRDGFRPTGSGNGQAQLFAVYQEVALAARPEEMLQILVRGLAGSLGADHCAFLFTVDQDRGRVIAVAERPEIRNHEVALDDYPEVRRAVDSGRTVFIPEVTGHPLFSRVSGESPLATFRPASAVAVPIRFQGRDVGVLVVRTTLPRPNLTVDEVAFVETLAASTARLLEHEERRATIYRRQASAGVVDALTGCGGLDALDRRVREEMQRADRYSRRFSLMLVDVVGLRLINTRHGVEAGDRVLSELGALLQRELRAPDFVARFGGDEFAVIMPETGEEAAADTLVRIRRAIDRHLFPGVDERVTVAAGWASYPATGILTAEDLFVLAEARLQTEKGKSPEAEAAA